MNGAIGIRGCRPVPAPVKVANPLPWARSNANRQHEQGIAVIGLVRGQALDTWPGCRDLKGARQRIVSRPRCRLLRLAVSLIAGRPWDRRARPGKSQADALVGPEHLRYGLGAARARFVTHSGLSNRGEQDEQAARCLNVDEERHHEEPGPGRRGRRPGRDITVEYVELQNAGVIVRNARVAEKIARRLRLGPSNRPGQSPSTRRSCNSSRPSPSR
jgi:hypothetical protein